MIQAHRFAGNMDSHSVSNKKALKSGIWYTAANFLMRSIGFLTTPIFARLLSHSEFGLYSNFTSWMSTLTVLVTLNLDATFINARYEFADKFDEYIFSVLSLSSLSGVLWLIGINLFRDQANSITGVDPFYLNLILLYLIALPAVNMFQGRERYIYHYKRSVLVSLLTSISTAFLSVLLVSHMDHRLTGRIVGQVLPTIFVGFVLYLTLAHRGKRVRTHYWKYALPICLPFIPHLLSLTLLNSMDRIMITQICGADDNAIYSLAYTCGAVITLLITSLNTAFSPWLGEKLHTDSISEIREVSKKYISLFLFLAVGIMLVTPEILLIMGGSSYSDAVYVMPPVSFGCVCQFLYTMHVNIEQFRKKTVGMAFASVSAALLNYILNALFIPRFGYVAAAYTTLASFLWLLLIHMILVRRIGYTDIYPIRYILGVLVGMSIYTIGINIVYGLPVIRYCLIVIYGVFFLYLLNRYKKEILIFSKDNLRVRQMKNDCLTKAISDAA